jgi:hypothetical protein
VLRNLGPGPAHDVSVDVGTYPVDVTRNLPDGSLTLEEGEGHKIFILAPYEGQPSHIGVRTREHPERVAVPLTTLDDTQPSHP